MNITLRRAASLQTAIQELARSIVVNPQATLSIFDDFTTRTDEARTGLAQSVARRRDLIAALFDIRGKTAEANQKAGITAILAEQAENGQLIELISGLAGATAAEEIVVTQKRAERLATREEPASHYGRPSGPVETLAVNILPRSEIDKSGLELLGLKSRRTHLRDRLAELNAVTQIELSPKTIEVLTTEHLL